MRFLPALLLIACTSGTTDADTAGGDDTDTAPDAVCDEPVAPPCEDEMFLDLSLHDDKKSHGDVTTVTDGVDFVTSIDASAGGYSQAANNAWTYVRFDDDGATKLDIDDGAALESMDWHLALRRYIVRINSGDSGPSCVGAAAVPGASYADLTTVPDDVDYQQDDYYDDECVITDDESGLPGSPAVAMGAWWEYPDGCLATTNTPFLLQLEDGRIVKLVVEGYYDADSQAECNETGATTGEGGYFTIRWRVM
jgi:hypothetical protein